MTATDQRRRPPYLGRRLLIFILVGVPLGGMLLLLAIPLVVQGNLDLGSAYTDPARLPMLVLLPPFWMVGIPPALLCGGLDARLAKFALAPLRRSLLTGTLGGILVLVPVIGLYLAGTIHGLLPLVVGLAGLATATVCSLLATLVDGK